jgi:predicted negative regulator of RcsB-dependent stress response
MENETEEQQIAKLKQWWSENGTSIIVGVVLGLGGVFGVKTWLGYQETRSEQASMVYSSMLQGLERGNQQLVSEQAETLMTKYSSTSYATLAALALAKIQLQDGDLEAANSQLKWVLDNADLDEIRETARLRLARVLIAQDRLDEAAALLDQPRSTTAYDNLYDEVAGDIQMARNNDRAASEAYKQALAATPAKNQATPGFVLLKLKYENALAASNGGNEVSQ